MNQEIAKNIMCIKLRNGIEIWVEKEKAQRLIDLLGTTKTKFVEIEDEIINSSEVSGVFTPKTMEDLTRRKNGEWKCRWNYWHNRGEQCAHGELKKYDK